MKIFIDKRVHQVIDEFYEYALLKHDALDEVTILKKVQRLYDALDALKLYARIYPIARLKKEWIEKEYREYICEDFHFAYQIYSIEDGSEIVRIHDACHSFLYTDRSKR